MRLNHFAKTVISIARQNSRQPLVLLDKKKQKKKLRLKPRYSIASFSRKMGKNLRKKELPITIFYNKKQW